MPTPATVVRLPRRLFRGVLTHLFKLRQELFDFVVVASVVACTNSGGCRWLSASVVYFGRFAEGGLATPE